MGIISSHGHNLVTVVNISCLMVIMFCDTYKYNFHCDADYFVSHIHNLLCHALNLFSHRYYFFSYSHYSLCYVH